MPIYRFFWFLTCLHLGNFAFGWVTVDSSHLRGLFDSAMVHSDQQLLLLQQGLRLSEGVKDLYWCGDFSLQIALYHGIQTGIPDSLLKYSAQARLFFRQSGRQLEEARAMMFLGIAEFQRGNEEPAMQWYTKSGELYQEIGADSLLASLYINMGHSLKEINHPLYLEYLRKANQLSRKFDEPRQEAITALGLTDAYLKDKQFDSAQVYITRAKELGQTLNDPQILSYSYRNVAQIENAKRNLSGIEENYHLAIRWAENLRDKAIFYNQLGDIYFQYEDYQSTIFSLLEAEKLALKIGAKQLLEPVYLTLRKALAKAGKWQQAIRRSDQYIKLKDSLFNERIRSEVAELTAKYETEKKERENQELIVHNFQQALKIGDLRKANQSRAVLILVLAATVLFGLIYYRINKKSQLQKFKIAEQEKTIRKQKIAELEREKNLVAIRSVVQGQEEERSRLAKELHDGLGGLFTAIKLSLDLIGRQSERWSEHDALNRSKDLVAKAAKEVRQIAHNLLPLSLSRFGLVTALEDLIEELNIPSHFQVQLQTFEIDLPNHSEVALAVYRITQELLHNAIKHSKATEIFVHIIQQNDVLDIVIEDNGTGFDVENRCDGSGLTNVQSRLQYLGGIMKIESDPGKGTTVNIECPLRKEILINHTTDG